MKWCIDQPCQHLYSAWESQNLFSEVPHMFPGLPLHHGVWMDYFLPASLKTLENGIKSHFQNWPQWPEPIAGLLPQESINPRPKHARRRLVEPALYPFFLPPWAGPMISLLLLLPDSLLLPPTTLPLQLQPLCQDASSPSLQDITSCCLLEVGHSETLLFLYQSPKASTAVFAAT